MIPVCNYVEKKDLGIKERYEWAVLDTFDMLSPTFDQPQTQKEVESALTASGVTQNKRLPNPGVNVVGTKA